jgi:Flp pilus assembly protein TadD
VNLSPADPELRAQLARTLRLTGKTAEAEELLTRVLAERPDAATAWGELGRIRLARGETAGALEAFEQGRRADPSKLDLHFLVGRLALRDGRLDDARQTLAGMKRVHATLRDLRKE